MKIQLRTSELGTLIDQAPDTVRYLSLDCFDTLVWRDTATPVDVFADLERAGGAIEPRRRAEGAARHSAKLLRDSFEVSIEEIHARLRPGGDAAASVAAELEAEARHCYGFRPVMDLIRDARARGLQIIIVSDTYLSEAQLRVLIAGAVGEEVAGLIDHIFPSSAFGVSKGDGLFGPVLDALGAKPEEILHIGDNHAADQAAPSKLGIHSCHLIQFDDQARTRLRLEAAASALIHPDVRVTRPAFQPQRPLVSLRDTGDTAHALGHDVLGPLLTTYARWLHAEREAVVTATGRRTHLLFLLRDGFLPAEIYDALYPDDDVKRIEISRHTAASAGLADEAAIRARLLADGPRNSVETLARQFMFKQGELARLKLDEPATDPDFVARATSPEMVGAITHRSAKFAERLIAHIRRAGVKDGDAVIFADLGYHGSVQDKITPMLEARMGLVVAGRYLVLREEQASSLDKKGMIDKRNYDFRTLETLCDPIAVVEQLCTVAQGSVVDYKFDGAPMRKAAGIKSQQSATRDAVQAGAGAFAQAASAYPLPGDAKAWRIAAGAALARLLFLPMPAEIDVLRCFDHDVNLGTDAVVPLVDPDAALAGLKARGLPYLMHSHRIYTPGEIRGHGMALSLSMLAWRRFGLELTTGDMTGTPMTLPVIMADATGETMIEAEAQPTHDGFYALALPVGTGRFTVGVQWGAAIDCVQIDTARFFIAEDYGTVADTMSAPAAMVHDGMEALADGLFRCTGPAALTMIPPPQLKRDVDVLLQIVFRPVVRRADIVEAKAAA